MTPQEEIRERIRYHERIARKLERYINLSERTLPDTARYLRCRLADEQKTITALRLALENETGGNEMTQPHEEIRYSFLCQVCDAHSEPKLEASTALLTAISDGWQIDARANLYRCPAHRAEEGGRK
jgi:hypothetical protein